MVLLDRFRAQPRQKHPDPAVRLTFVQEIPLTEHELVEEMARGDADARVRRAAVAKLLDPRALASIAATDAEESVRAAAAAMLRDIALEAFEGLGEADSVAAVDAASDARTLAIIAKSAPRESTAQRALARTIDQRDQRVLGSIARHAEHESVRRAAFEALDDHTEVLGVVLNSEFREPALSAVDRVTERGELEQIANRARNKSAAKRARAVLREIEERVARAAAAVRAEAEASEQAARQAARTTSAEQERRVRAEAARQAAAERAAAEEEVASRRRAEEEAREVEARARREAADEAARKDLERRRVRLAELAGEAVRAAAVEDLGSARRQFGVVRREWADVGNGITVDPEIAARYTEAEAAITARASTIHEQDQRTRREALARLQQLAARVEALAAREELTLKAGDRALRDLRNALGGIPPLPSRKDYEEIVRRLRAAQGALTPKVQELRNVADWQRWANVGIQEQLCEKMEALKGLDGPDEIVRHVRDLQQQWRQAADVPHAQGEILWKRFKAAHDEVWAKCASYFAAQAEAHAANLAKKVALCERAEALAGSTAWIQTAEQIKALQAEWKAIGPVTRGQEKGIWERFRAACDRFFTRRHADLAERKKMWAENLAKKEALCRKVEALAQSSDWAAAAADIKTLQSEWKAIGPVKKSRSEAIWQRFRGASDTFFARYAQRHDTARAERVVSREAIVAELEALAAPGPDAESPEAVSGSSRTPQEIVAKVCELRGRWQRELALRGVDRERASALDARFAAAFSRAIARHPGVFGGTDLDPDANRRRMETLVNRMEELARSVAGPGGADAGDAALSPTTRLAAMLKEALAANTIGGKTDDDHRLRAAAEEMRQAQASWSRIGPVPDHERRALADRFQRAMRKISDRAGEAGALNRPAGSGKLVGPGR